LHDEEFYLGKVEDPMSPRSQDELSFSSTGELLTKRLRTLREHNNLLDRYITIDAHDGHNSHDGCLVKNCPLKYCPMPKKKITSDEEMKDQ
jgi:hypothetical protein